MTKNIKNTLINNTKSKFNVDITDVPKQAQFIITGFKCSEAKKYAEEIVRKLADGKYPSTWDDVIELIEKNIKIKINHLDSSSKEFMGISDNFKKTMPQSTIMKIERI